MKHVRKITPVSLYDAPGLESWLEDMAGRGLTPKRLRPAFSTFERDRPQAVRYRAEPYRRIMEEEPPQAMLDLYRDFGWTFVCATPELLLFSTRDPDAPEPHSDPKLQAGLWKKLYRSKRRNFFVQLPLALAALACTPVLFLMNNTPTLALLTTAAPIVLLYSAFLLAGLPKCWSDVQRLALLVRQLEEDLPLGHRSFYPRRRWREIADLAIAVILLAVLTTVNNILPLTGGGVQSLDSLTAFAPLSLAEMEGAGYLPHTVERDGQDYANFVRLRHYLLCPNQWQVVQTGRAGPGDQARLGIWRYDLPGPLSPLSVPLARELLDQETGINRPAWWIEHSGPVWTVEYLPRTGVSFLAAARHQNGEFQIVAAAAGNRAVLVRYTGAGDLTDYLDQIIEMLN